MQRANNNTKEYKVNICPIPPRKKSESNTYSPEIVNLLDEYKKIKDRLRVIRGTLYKQGIDPEKN